MSECGKYVTQQTKNTGALCDEPALHAVFRMFQCSECFIIALSTKQSCGESVGTA